MVLAPYFDGPQIAWEAGARIVAGPDHRNGQGMIDIVDAFTGRDHESKRIVDERQVDFVVLCTTYPSARALAMRNPEGLAARLLRNQAPPWLEPLPARIDPRVKVWRVLGGHARGSRDRAPG
jgi:hypothetical protein